MLNNPVTFRPPASGPSTVGTSRKRVSHRAGTLTKKAKRTAPDLLVLVPQFQKLHEKLKDSMHLYLMKMAEMESSWNPDNVSMYLPELHYLRAQYEYMAEVMRLEYNVFTRAADNIRAVLPPESSEPAK